MGKQVLLTIPKLAEEYEIAERLLYRWAWAGELAGAVKLRGRWYVRVPAFEAWLNADAPDGTPAQPKERGPSGDDVGGTRTGDTGRAAAEESER